MTTSVGSVPARYFVLLRDALAAQGVDTGELLRTAKVDPARFEHPDTRLPPAQVHDLVAAMRRLTGRSDLGFELGKLAKINTHDMLGYGLISCRTLDHMLQLGSRYYHLVNEVCTMTYRRHGARGEVVFSPIAALPLETLRLMQCRDAGHRKDLQQANAHNGRRPSSRPVKARLLEALAATIHRARWCSGAARLPSACRNGVASTAVPASSTRSTA
jgi:hypothetical protein